MLAAMGALAAAAASPPARPLVYGGDANFPPYEYVGPRGEPEGYNVELVRELARHEGREVEIRLGPWKAILAEFDAGAIDLTSLAHSDARAAHYDLLVQTWTLKQGLSFKPGRTAYPQELDQLAGEVVAVEENGATHDLLRNLPEDRRPTIVPAPDHRAALRMVDRGQATVAVGNALTLRFVAHELGIQGLVEVQGEANSYYLATQRGRGAELAWIPEGYARLGTDGTRDRLVEKYLAARPSPWAWRDVAGPIFVVAGFLAAAATAVGLWNRALRRRVWQRTAELRASLQDKDALAHGLAGSEEALREANEALHSLIEASPLAVVVLDTAGRVRHWNAASERLFGWTADEAVGKSPLYVPDWHEAASRSLFDRAVRGETLTGIEAQRQRKDGALVDVAISVAPVRGRAGAITGAIAVLADVGERVQLEAQLRQSQKMEAVGRLAGGIAHDFNNLLTAITGYTDLLLLGLRDPSLRARAEAIGKAADRAAALTSQLLSFSRKQVLTSRVIDLNAVLASVESVLRRVIGEDIAIVRVAAPGLWPVRADPSQVEQVLMNLAVNARDAMPAGGTLTLETANVDLTESFGRLNLGSRPGAHVLLAVHDTGAGMEPEVQKRVFEPFFTTKEAGRGTGLGLATVYGIVKQSGGYITLESAAGRGSTFRVYLPRAVAEEAGLPAAATPDEGPPSPRPERRPVETILLAEDDEVVRDLAREILEAQGYTVLAARHAGEALLIAERHAGPIHLLVTDVVMPHMGGRELAERVGPLRPGMKVLYVSGYTDDAVLRHGVMGAEVAFLQKPFSAVALRSKVRMVLEGGEAAFPAPPGAEEARTDGAPNDELR